MRKIFAFLRAVRSGGQALSRSRLMFVGDGGTGKTTLKAALQMSSAGADGMLRQLTDTVRAQVLRWKAAQVQDWIASDPLATRRAAMAAALG